MMWTWCSSHSLSQQLSLWPSQLTPCRASMTSAPGGLGKQGHTLRYKDYLQYVLFSLFSFLWILIIGGFIQVSSKTPFFWKCKLFPIPTDFFLEWGPGVCAVNRRCSGVLWLHHIWHPHHHAQAFPWGVHHGCRQPLPGLHQPLCLHPAHYAGCSQELM